MCHRVQIFVFSAHTSLICRNYIQSTVTSNAKELIMCYFWITVKPLPHWRNARSWLPTSSFYALNNTALCFFPHLSTQNVSWQALTCRPLDQRQRAAIELRRPAKFYRFSWSNVLPTLLPRIEENVRGTKEERSSFSLSYSPRRKVMDRRNANGKIWTTTRKTEEHCSIKFTNGVLLVYFQSPVFFVFL